MIFSLGTADGGLGLGTVMTSGLFLAMISLLVTWLWLLEKRLVTVKA